MNPIIPHFSNECLKIMKVKKMDWPNYDKSFLKENLIKIVVQINGKKRGLVEAKPNISENELYEAINSDESLTKYFSDEIIKKKIYIKNRLINIII